MLKSDNKMTESAYWCVVSASDIWVSNDQFPYGSADELGLNAEYAICIGHHQGHKVYWLNDCDVESELVMVSLRELLHWPESSFLMASKAIQYGHMTQSMRFCPQCGGRNHLNHNQVAMQCGDCRALHYPRIFPCIIVAVRNDNKILLAQHPRHKTGMYTVIAGFLEVGETLEQCVAREVKEETGIDISNIRYFGSQPWAFPSSMMMGFLADYAGGTLKPDYSELSDAQWFDVTSLPDVAPVGTIARELIEKTVDGVMKGEVIEQVLEH